MYAALCLTSDPSYTSAIPSHLAPFFPLPISRPAQTSCIHNLQVYMSAVVNLGVLLASRRHRWRGALQVRVVFQKSLVFQKSRVKGPMISGKEPNDARWWIPPYKHTQPRQLLRLAFQAAPSDPEVILVRDLLLHRLLRGNTTRLLLERKRGGEERKSAIAMQTRLDGIRRARLTERHAALPDGHAARAAGRK